MSAELEWLFPAARPPLPSGGPLTQYGRTRHPRELATRCPCSRISSWRMPARITKRVRDPSRIQIGLPVGKLDHCTPRSRNSHPSWSRPLRRRVSSMFARMSRGSALLSMASPVTLVIDDVHVLRDRECRSALSVLADHVPPGSRLALASRAEPPLRIARLRAEGKILEIGPGDLALTRREASSLLQNDPAAGGPVRGREHGPRAPPQPGPVLRAASTATGRRAGA
jgi:hypothetical protein